MRPHPRNKESLAPGSGGKAFFDFGGKKTITNEGVHKKIIC